MSDTDDYPDNDTIVVVYLYDLFRTMLSQVCLQICPEGMKNLTLTVPVTAIDALQHFETG